MDIKKYAIISIILTVSAVTFFSCTLVKDVSQALANLKRLQFKIESVNNFSLMGITLANKKSITDFSITDGLKLTNAFTSKQIPVDFIINVAAINPNDGTTDTRQTSATVAGLDWRLIIDNKETIRGDISSPVTIPGTGQSVIIPVRAGLDMYRFFGDRGYDGVLNLCLALGGLNSSPSRVKLDAKPTVNTAYGQIVYPSRITIVDKQYN